MTLYRETPCEHGLMDKHDWYVSRPLQHGDSALAGYFDGLCPGGSREEVTINYEAAIAKHNELYPVPLSARGEAWVHEIVDAARGITEKEK